MSWDHRQLRTPPVVAPVAGVAIDTAHHGTVVRGVVLAPGATLVLRELDGAGDIKLDLDNAAGLGSLAVFDLALGFADDVHSTAAGLAYIYTE